MSRNPFESMAAEFSGNQDDQEMSAPKGKGKKGGFMKAFDNAQKKSPKKKKGKR